MPKTEITITIETPANAPCGYVNRAGDVKDCTPDHDSAEDIRARLAATGGYLNLPEPMGCNWHGSDYRLTRHREGS